MKPIRVARRSEVKSRPAIIVAITAALLMVVGSAAAAPPQQFDRIGGSGGVIETSTSPTVLAEFAFQTEGDFLELNLGWWFDQEIPEPLDVVCELEYADDTSADDRVSFFDDGSSILITIDATETGGMELAGCDDRIGYAELEIIYDSELLQMEIFRDGACGGVRSVSQDQATARTFIDTADLSVIIDGLGLQGSASYGRETGVCVQPGRPDSS